MTNSTDKIIPATNTKKIAHTPVSTNWTAIKQLTNTYKTCLKVIYASLSHLPKTPHHTSWTPFLNIDKQHVRGLMSKSPKIREKHASALIANIPEMTTQLNSGISLLQAEIHDAKCIQSHQQRLNQIHLNIKKSIDTNRPDLLLSQIRSCNRLMAEISVSLPLSAKYRSISSLCDNISILLLLLRSTISAR